MSRPNWAGRRFLWDRRGALAKLPVRKGGQLQVPARPEHLWEASRAQPGCFG